ncbi:MAG: hypothetical protein ACR2KV_09510 [Solirubrobacteraceae bacterium]
MAEHPTLNYERDRSGDPVVLLNGIGGELGIWEPEHDDSAADEPDSAPRPGDSVIQAGSVR